MPRYKLTLEYDGTAYNGFQAQDGQPTVQGAIETAIHAFSGDRIRIAAAGRTDTGVHALEQVIHADLQRAWPETTILNAMNAHLVKEDVCVLSVEPAPDPDWHARFSATGRGYLYRILNRRPQPVLERDRVWHVKKPLDAEAMHQAAQILVGHHDFTTFRDVGCQSKSAVKTLDVARVTRFGQEVHLVFQARSFLHRQVRSMAGTLVEVGLGRWTAHDVRRALEAKDRAECGPVAPSTGLYLSGVRYD